MKGTVPPLEASVACLIWPQMPAAAFLRLEGGGPHVTDSHRRAPQRLHVKVDRHANAAHARARWGGQGGSDSQKQGSCGKNARLAVALQLIKTEV